MSHKPSILDRTLGYFAPRVALKRHVARRLLTRAYEGASIKDGWQPRRAGASAQADHLSDARMLRHRARTLVQNNPYAAKALHCLVANIVGNGLVPESAAPDKRQREALNDLWKRWGAVADADGKLDIYGIQALAYRAMEQDGECLIRLRTRRPEDGLPVPLQLQLLEIDYLDTTRNGIGEAGGMIVEGIETDTIGRVVAYWLFKRHPGDTMGFNIVGQSGGLYVSDRIPASSIIHLFAPERPGQARGITRFAPVIARLYDLKVYEDAELARKQNEALMSVFISGDGADFAVPGPDESQAAAVDKANTIGELGTLKPGAIMATGGQSVTFAEPKAAPGYNDYVRGQLASISAGLGVTYEMLTGDLSQVNFSSARMGMMEFRRLAEQRQWQVLIPRLCERVWREFTAMARTVGLVPGAYPDDAVEWTCPRWDYVNPIDDVKADIAEVENGLVSLSEKIRERGYKPERVYAELGEDFRALKDTGAIDLLQFLRSTVRITAPGSEQQVISPGKNTVDFSAVTEAAAGLVSAAARVIDRPALVEIKQEPVRVDIHQEPVQVDVRHQPVEINLTQEPVQVHHDPVRVELVQGETHVHLHRPGSTVEKIPEYDAEGQCVRVLEREIE